MEYVKNRTENFDDYYPCKRKPDCNFNHHVLPLVHVIIHIAV